VLGSGCACFAFDDPSPSWRGNTPLSCQRFTRMVSLSGRLRWRPRACVGENRRIRTEGGPVFVRGTPTWIYAACIKPRQKVRQVALRQRDWCRYGRRGRPRPSPRRRNRCRHRRPRGRPGVVPDDVLGALGGAFAGRAGHGSIRERNRPTFRAQPVAGKDVRELTLAGAERVDRQDAVDLHDLVVCGSSD
jgi:hypothetical protein